MSGESDNDQPNVGEADDNFKIEYEDVEEIGIQEVEVSSCFSIRIDHCYSQAGFIINPLAQAVENGWNNQTLPSESSDSESTIILKQDPVLVSLNESISIDDGNQQNLPNNSFREHQDMETQTSFDNLLLEAEPPTHSQTRFREHCLFCLRKFESKSGKNDIKLLFVMLQSYQECDVETETLIFVSENIAHLRDCTPMLSKILDAKKSLCLVCKIRWPSYNLCGLIRHTISCLIEERESILLAPIVEPHLPQLASNTLEVLNAKSTVTTADTGYCQEFRQGGIKVDEDDKDRQSDVATLHDSSITCPFLFMRYFNLKMYI